MEQGELLGGWLFTAYPDAVRLVCLWIVGMGIPMLLQCREAQHLLSGGDTQFAVNVLIVILQCIFGNTEDFSNLLGILPC
jgi:hypothetical protein